MEHGAWYKVGRLWMQEGSMCEWYIGRRIGHVRNSPWVLTVSHEWFVRVYWGEKSGFSIINSSIRVRNVNLH